MSSTWACGKPSITTRWGRDRDFGRRLVVMAPTLACRGRIRGDLAGIDASVSILPPRQARGWRIHAWETTQETDHAQTGIHRNDDRRLGRVVRPWPRRRGRKHAACALAEAREGQGRLHARRQRKRHRYRRAM